MSGHVIVFGELLWDLLPNGKVLGGAPANFAYRLNSFGLDTRLISSVGKDELGDLALCELENRHVPIAFIQRHPTLPTGTVDVSLSPQGNASYTINKNVAYDAIEYTDQIDSMLNSTQLICFGTLSQRSPISRKTLSSILKNTQTKPRFFDINLRKDCFTSEIIRDSLNNTTIVKMNDDEMRQIAQMFDLNAGSFQLFAQGLFNKFPVDVCLVTMAERGVLALERNGEVVQVSGMKVEVIDTIGSGDAFSAGFCFKYLNRANVKEACEFGNLIGASVATTRGGMTEINLS